MKISRRVFLGTSAAALLAVQARAAAGGFKDYTPGMIETLLRQGKTVFVDYAADWCGTCARQERVIGELIQENPAYLKNVEFVRVDWDDFRKAEVTTSRQIPRRSTLLVLKSNKELGRIVAGTAKSDIKALMDTALAAATSA